MKTLMNSLAIFRRRVFYAGAAALVFACRTAEACPGCKQAVGGDGAGGSRQINPVAIGYAVSIGFMLFMIAGLLTALGYMMYRNCQTLALQQQAALREEPDFGHGGSLPGGMRA